MSGAGYLLTLARYGCLAAAMGAAMVLLFRLLRRLGRREETAAGYAFILPWLTRGVRAVHDAGRLCVKHTDGDISGIIDLLVGTGIDGIGPLEPEAGNDLVELQRTWWDRVAVVGNIDVDLLCRGATGEVVKATESLVRKLAPRGGHVLASGNTITSSVKPENFRTMVEAGRAVAFGAGFTPHDRTPPESPVSRSVEAKPTALYTSG